MLIGFTGGLGSGKTKGLVYFGNYLHYLTKKPVYTNFYTTFGEQLSTWKELTEKQNSIILLDELHILMDSRLSGASTKQKTQTYRTHFILQTRKKDLLVLYTTQQFFQIDKRVRYITDKIFLCEKIKGMHRYTIVDGYSMNIEKTYTVNNINEANKWYNTNEIVTYLK